MSASTSKTQLVLALPLYLYEKYIPVRMIGRGGNGMVYLVRERATRMLFACKVADYTGGDDSVEKRDLHQEVSILQSFCHPNIVAYQDFFDDTIQKKFYTIMEYCAAGDLFAFVEKTVREGKTIPERRICSILAQIARALHYMHTEKGTVHRDIKLENVVLAADSSIRLIDVGEATRLSPGTVATAVIGTPGYLCPEILREQPYDSKADLWSLGVVAFQLMSLEMPFDEDDEVATDWILSTEYRPPTVPAAYSYRMQAIIDGLLDINPASRLSATDLLSRPEISLEGRIIDCDSKAARLESLETTLGHQAEAIVTERAVFEIEQSRKEVEWVRREADWQERERLKEQEWTDRLAALNLHNSDRPIKPLKRRVSGSDLGKSAGDELKRGRAGEVGAEAWWPFKRIWKVAE